VNLLKNKISIAQAKAVVLILKEHPTLKSLCGNKGNETELDMSGKMYGAGDAIMLAAEIVDNGALTSLNLSSNELEAEGAKIVVEAIKVTTCAIAIILAPFVCSSDHWLNCCCSLLSTGYGGIIYRKCNGQPHRQGVPLHAPGDHALQTKSYFSLWNRR
jgi:hypothetical protein